MSPIFVITGPPGAGKTSVAVRLMQRFPFGLHIPVDDLRDWVVSGLATPVPNWTEETTRQFRLARGAAADLSRRYAEAGFAVAIDDVVFPAEVPALYGEPLAGFSLYKVALLPRLEIALERNARRTTKDFDTAILSEPIKMVWQRLNDAHFDASWIVVDSSDLTVDETVRVILDCAGENPRVTGPTPHQRMT